ncbi:MlaD family protein [Paracoccus aerodenitrificans]|uniref:MlaD family protein n=1 Tax=Paracoccus aerodenitrificans TaxID=3017781 RepID=UPI0022F13D01|nr:MlaD family protein [Paracoccus aerodenitrificans]WBU63514.1 MlaD family protein [Paracoccus aerodenitrificans]
METKANYVLIGTFTVFGFLGILGFLMWFAKLELNRQFAYYDVYFPDVAGLSVSSQVLFAGLSVGEVVDMTLVPDGEDAVRIRLEVDEDTPVRTDSLASLETSAVTGVSIVEISSGSRDAPFLADSSDDQTPVIRTGRSALQSLEQQAPELLGRLNRLAMQLNQLLGPDNQQRVASILTNVESASGNLNRTMEDISAATEAIASAASDFEGFGSQLKTLGDTAGTTLTRFSDAASEAEIALATVNSYVTDDLTPLTTTLRETALVAKTDLAALGERAQGSLDKFDTAAESATRTFDAVTGVVDEVGPVFSDLRVTLGGMNEAMSGLPEALPRIIASVSNAGDSAAAAFESLRVMLDSSRQPVQVFTRESLPQFSRLSTELRSLVSNADQFISALRRNPAQLLQGQPTPEFRR